MPTTACAEDAILENITASVALQQTMLADRELIKGISAAADIILHALRQEGRVLLAGNGGSAADAQHIAAEFLGRSKMERRAIPAMALTANTSTLTAIANNCGFDTVFARQVEAFARPGDVLIVISTSGDSRNLLRAVVMAGALRTKTIALTGQTGGKLRNSVDLCLRVPSREMPRIQEAHLLIAHTISEIVEAEMFPLEPRRISA